MIFNLHRLVVGIQWAKTLSWQVTNDREVRVLYLSMHKVTEADGGLNAYGVIVGPISLTFGWAG